ncbi:hypothetical protein CGZ80_23950 [Rhodopirellula sp. MGV]|nr:hypothetical protein CGZ80_23950 [Rhodopirellula sp. MGV]PNY33845.1 FAD-dependent oxidoreductase [Rhodopirellula baltica]
MSIAYELANRGITVTVLERDAVFDHAAESSIRRSASSWAASGILPPANFETATDPIDRLRGLSHQLFPEWAQRFIDETGIDCELERCGGWYLADTPGETASMMGMVHYWQELSIECEHRSLEDLAKHQPLMQSWASNVDRAQAWWVPDEYQIRTPLFLDGLTAACRAKGVALVDRVRVLDFDDGGQTAKVFVERHSGGLGSDSLNTERVTFEADLVVVCGGSWTGLVSPRLKLSRSVIPMRGQILLLDMGERKLTSVLNFGNRYIVPRQDGLVLVGSCEEEVGLQHGTTPRVMKDLRDFVATVCPELSRATQVTAWSGLRPMTFDGFPMFGKLPDHSAIYVASGHYRSGIHLAPATAVCMADLIAGKAPPLSLEPFSVGKQQSHPTQQQSLGSGT